MVYLLGRNKQAKGNTMNKSNNTITIGSNNSIATLHSLGPAEKAVDEYNNSLIEAALFAASILGDDIKSLNQMEVDIVLST